MPFKQIIKTKRITLEPIKKKYFQRMYELLKEDNKEISRWQPIAYPIKKKKTNEYYKKTMKDKNNCQFVIINKETNEIMGCLGLLKEKINNSATIGYWIGKEYRNKGYVSEATEAVISFLFTKWNIMRIEIQAEEKNIPSLKVIEKCGFKYEGTKRMAALNGHKQYGNSRMYSIIRPEWKK